jgi:hypothetical protein
MNILPLTPGVSKIGTASAQFAEINALDVRINGVTAATTGRATDAFGALTDSTTNDATTLKHGFMSKLDKIKLDTIATGAQVNPTDAAIATSYNSQVAQVSGGEISAASSTAIRRYSPADIAAIANVRIAASAGGLDSAAVVSAVSTATANTDSISKTLDTGVLTYNVRRKSSGLTSGSEGLIGSDSSGLFVTLGNTGNTALAGNDARLLTTDEKAAVTASAAPAAGNPFMTATGARAIKLDDFAAPDDNTDLDATTGAHGLMSKNDKIALDALPARATDAFGALTDITDNDATILKHGFLSKLDKIKLDTIATGAQVNPTDAAIAAIADARIAVASATGRANSIALLIDSKASGTAAGSSTATTWHHRDINTEVYDPGGIVSIAANVFTVAAGTYRIAATAPNGGSSVHRLRLWNTTTNAEVSTGIASQSRTGDSGGNDYATLKGIFTVGATTSLRLDHYITGAISTFGLGRAGSIAGVTETYTQLTLEKLS